MNAKGLRIGQIASQAGVTRKAVRVYEAAGIVRAPGRTGAGYRVYTPEAVSLLRFVRRAQGIGFTLAEIKQIVGLKEAGAKPCDHVRALARAKIEDVDRRLEDLRAVRTSLAAMLAAWQRSSKDRATVCPHIENGTDRVTTRRKRWKR